MTTILDDAAKITAGDRNADYGHPLRNHQEIARLWNAFLNNRDDRTAPLLPEDVVHMMILLKVARNAHKHKRDSLVDIAGYARCLEVIEDYTQAVAENP